MGFSGINASRLENVHVTTKMEVTIQAASEKFSSSINAWKWHNELWAYLSGWTSTTFLLKSPKRTPPNLIKILSPFLASKLKLGERTAWNTTVILLPLYLARYSLFSSGSFLLSRLALRLSSSLSLKVLESLVLSFFCLFSSWSSCDPTCCLFSLPYNN